MKKLLKSIITSILVAAVTLTSIAIDATTANAATIKGGEFQDGGSVTLKPGDELRLTVTDTNKIFPTSYKTDYDITDKYRWSSSDENVLKVETDLYDEVESLATCVVLIAVGSGTATVTGTHPKGPQPDITMTVTVTLPKATAKQKKCKHSWKTTKKATCERGGVKTCKKCKLQKAIAKKAHAYVDKKVTTMEYDYYIQTWYCSGCDCEDDGLFPKCMVTGYCPTRCNFEVKFRCKAGTGEITPNTEYPITSEDEAMSLIEEHHLETNLRHTGWGTNLGDNKPYGEGHPVTTTVKVCKNCGYRK